MPIPAGRLNHPVRLEKSVTERTKVGQAKKGFQQVAVVLAWKETIAGSERFARQVRTAEVTTKYTIRWEPGLKPFDALFDLEEERRYDITEMLEVGNREGWAILARALVEA